MHPADGGSLRPGCSPRKIANLCVTVDEGRRACNGADHAVLGRFSGEIRTVRFRGILVSTVPFRLVA
jgi:hypothetical protein